jgi:hypothetical protein
VLEAEEEEVVEAASSTNDEPLQAAAAIKDAEESANTTRGFMLGRASSHP